MLINRHLTPQQQQLTNVKRHSPAPLRHRALTSRKAVASDVTQASEVSDSLDEARLVLLLVVVAELDLALERRELDRLLLRHRMRSFDDRVARLQNKTNR